MTKNKKTPRQKMSAEEAKAILREYPDADLSAFDITEDVENLAIEAAGESLAAIRKRATK